MKLVKCNNGHFYDGEKYSTCPHCGGISNNSVTAPVEEPKPTPATEPVTEPIDDDADSKTVPMYGNYETGKPVVGWLVCIEGSLLGRSFELFAGMNFIGRNKNNHICIPLDASVSREKHGIVIYDPRSKTFMIQSGMSAELLYLNDAVVLQPVNLNPYDTLLLGTTKFLFVPFCGEKYSWK